MPIKVKIKNEQTGLVYEMEKNRAEQWVVDNPHLTLLENQVIKVEPIKKKEDAPPVEVKLEVKKENGQAELKIPQGNVSALLKEIEALHDKNILTELTKDSRSTIQKAATKRIAQL